MSETKKEENPEVLDLYIRMNEDYEKDYCFSVPINSSVSSLKKVFEILPMSLTPSYFYRRIPLGFAVSSHPGFLTSEGGLLFHQDALQEKYLTKIDQNAPIQNVIWEGQLVVPLWDFDYSRYTIALSVLAIWLYTDLPQYITPTPGISATTLVMYVADKLIGAPDNGDESGAFEGPYWAWGFFFLHILKVGIIYIILRSGGINPLSFNPLQNRRMASKSHLSYEILQSIGWTGTRRATPNEWREENRKAVIENAGGIVSAYNQGLLTNLSVAGEHLGPGEGFATPIFPRNPAKDRLADPYPDPLNFTLSHAYFADVFGHIASILSDNELSNEAKATILKSFRRRGPEHASPAFKAFYVERKKLKDPLFFSDPMESIVPKEKIETEEKEAE